MLTRRNSIILSAKGLAALMAAMPFLSGCAPEGDEDLGVDGGLATGPTGGQMPSIDAGTSPFAGRDAGEDGPVDLGAAEGDGASDMAFEPAVDMAVEPAVDMAVEPAVDMAQPSPPAPEERRDWDTFLSELETLARTQFSPDWDQETYVEEVKALMVLLDLEDEQLNALYANYVNAARDFPELTTVHEGGFFEVATLQFEPGEHIPLHNHPDMTGVIFCLSGRMDVEAFDLLPETSDDGNLLLRRVEETTLVPGEFATLTAGRGNIHALTAREFTELLDVFTPPYDDARIARYRWYDRASDAYDGDAVYEAWAR